MFINKINFNLHEKTYKKVKRWLIISDPTDKELFRRYLLLGILSPILLILSLLFIYYFPWEKTLFPLEFFIFLGWFGWICVFFYPIIMIFSIIIYVTKPDFYRKRLLKAWAKKQKKKKQKKKSRMEFNGF